jgi:hypothetical protein
LADSRAGGRTLEGPAAGHKGYAGAQVVAWATYAVVTPVSALERLVNRELLDVGTALQLDTRCCCRRRDARFKGVEVLTRLPEVDHAPPAFDRTRGVKQKALRGVPLRIDVLVYRVELLLADASELNRIPTAMVSLSSSECLSLVRAGQAVRLAPDLALGDRLVPVPRDQAA